MDGLFVEFAEVVYMLFLHLASDESESAAWLLPRGWRVGCQRCRVGQFFFLEELHMPVQ